MNPYIAKAITLSGSQAALAEACGVSQPAVHKWLHGGKIEPMNAKTIEIVTRGAVNRRDLCPGIWDNESPKKNGNKSAVST